MLSLYLLLLFMGATVGEIPDIKGQLSVAGFNALIIASGTSVVNFITLVAVGKLVEKNGFSVMLHTCRTVIQICCQFFFPRLLR